jgi:hypothetical protein
MAFLVGWEHYTQIQLQIQRRIEWVFNGVFPLDI